MNLWQSNVVAVPFVNESQVNAIGLGARLPFSDTTYVDVVTQRRLLTVSYVTCAGIIVQ